MEIAAHVGAEVHIQDFPMSVDDAVERDNVRRDYFGDEVGEDVIRSMASRYHIRPNGELPEAPTLDGDTAGEQPYTGTPGRPAAVIVDLDGTVALHNGRSPYDYDRVGEDLPNQPVIDLVRELKQAGYQIIFVSGRPDSCAVASLYWVERNVNTDGKTLYHGPFMRKTGDNRDDSIVKREIFDEQIRDRFDVKYVLDDRNRVVRMWRRLGIPTLQVADGAF
jgi:hypothetical protein